MGSSTLLVLFVLLVLSFAAFTSAQEPEKEKPVTVTLKAGDLTCVLGDHRDHGAGKTGYIGIHQLTHTAEPESPFFPRYAGIIISRNEAQVKQVSEREGEISHLFKGQETHHMRFALVPPNAIDVTVTVPSGAAGGFINSCSYMNGPEDPGIYFVDPKDAWQRHYDPVHGNAASVFPEGMPLPVLQKVPNATYKHGTNSFADSVSEWRYDPKLAFYYGRFKNMVFIQMFPPESRVIFYMSPTGGGTHPSGRRNPAWDWRIQIPKNQIVDNKVSLRLRLVYKPFVSQEDVLREYRNWCETLK
jgi:hypothetical protein